MDQGALDGTGDFNVPDRRRALFALMSGVAVWGGIESAKAEVVSSVDTIPLQFALNLQYLTTNFLQVVIYGLDHLLAGDLIRGGEVTDKPGVQARGILPVKFAAADRRDRTRLNEIADEHWWRLNLIRGFLRGDAPAQKLIDCSPETFSAMFQAARAIADGAIFNPYESVDNCLLAADTLISVAASVYSAILPSITDEIATPTMASIAASTASNATTIRSMLFDRAQANPAIPGIIDQLAAWRDRIDGTAQTDLGLSSVTDASGATVTRLAASDSSGLYLGRTPQQALNVLFMTSAAATTGGFFPTGINGSIVSSAAN